MVRYDYMSILKEKKQLTRLYIMEWCWKGKRS